MRRMFVLRTILILTMMLTAWPSVAEAQPRRGQQPVGSAAQGQSSVLDPDTVIVEVREDSPGKWSARIGDRTVSGVEFAEIERRAIAAHRGRAILFMDAQGRTIHISPRTMMGVVVEPVRGALAAQLNLAEGAGLVVTEVQEGLPAQRAGLARHDVIIEFAGRRPMTMTAFSEVVATQAPGQVVSTIVYRGGRELEFEVRLAAYDPAVMGQVRTGPGTDPEAIAAIRRSLRELEEARERKGEPQAVGVTEEREIIPLAGLPAPGPWFRWGAESGDAAWEALREDLDGIRAQLRRIEEALEALILAESQRQGGASQR